MKQYLDYLVYLTSHALGGGAYWRSKCLQEYPDDYETLKQSSFEKTYELCQSLSVLKDKLNLTCSIQKVQTLIKIIKDGDPMFIQIPNQICLLTKLTHLIVNYNALTELPPEIGELKSLEYLNVSRN